MWQSLSFGANYKAAYCLSVCPAGEEVIGPYLTDKAGHLREVVRPLQEKEETVYVVPGSDAEEHVARRFPLKTIKRVGNGLRPRTIQRFLSGLPLTFQPGKAAKLNAVYHFTFTGKEQKQATVTIRDGTLQVQDGHQGEADLRVTADSETWLGFLAKERSLLWALLRRRIRIKGSPKLLVPSASVFRREKGSPSVSTKIINTGARHEHVHEQGRRRHGRQQRDGPGSRPGVQPPWCQGRHQRSGREDAGRSRSVHRRRHAGRACGRVSARSISTTSSPAPRSVSAPSTCCSSTPGSPSSLPFEQTTEAMHDEILDINFKGAFFTVQKALPLLKDGGADRHQHVRRRREIHAERQRLCGEQGGAAVADPRPGANAWTARRPAAGQGQAVPAEPPGVGGPGDVAERGPARQGHAVPAPAPGERRGLRRRRGPGPVPRGRRVHRRGGRLGPAPQPGSGTGLAEQLRRPAVLPVPPVPGRQRDPGRHRSTARRSRASPPGRTDSNSS